MLLEVLLFFILSTLQLISLLLTVAMLTLWERRLIGRMQRRRGPNKLGMWGSLQAIADGLKLLIKEPNLPLKSDLFLYKISPVISFFSTLISFCVLPYDLNLSLLIVPMDLLFILAMNSIHIFTIILAGWASNSKYPFLGGLRAVAQLISYELCITLSILMLIIFTNSFNISDIVLNQANLWNIFSFFPIFIIFFVCTLAETARIPFDLPEAEAELVSGYNTEYGSSQFTLFFLSEYLNIILISCLITFLFFGGWNNFSFCELAGFLNFTVKWAFVIFLIIWVRVSLPRYRYDQLMSLGWKYFLPILFSLFFLFSLILFFKWVI